MDKLELINKLREKNNHWEAVLAEVGPERMEVPGVNGDWTMKDVVAHLTGWNRRLVGSLQAAGRGDPEPPPPWPSHLQTEDEINAWIYSTNRRRALRTVLDESHQVLRELLGIIDRLPEDVRAEQREPDFQLVWVGGKRFLASEFFDHFRDDHEPDVRRWLKRQSPG